MDLEIELVNDAEVTLTYLAEEGQEPRAVIRRGDRPEQQEITGQEAIDQTQAIAGAIPPLPTGEPLTLIQAVLDQLAIAQADVKEFELDFLLTDGTRGSVELQVDERDDDWDDD